MPFRMRAWSPPPMLAIPHRMRVPCRRPSLQCDTCCEVAVDVTKCTSTDWRCTRSQRILKHAARRCSMRPDLRSRVHIRCAPMLPVILPCLSRALIVVEPCRLHPVINIGEKAFATVRPRDRGSSSCSNLSLL
jgi:hypothetical protein